MAFHVNGNRVPFQFSAGDAVNWPAAKKMELVLFRGDIITITGKDAGGLPVLGLSATIHFFDVDGKEFIYNTDVDWFCDGKPAIITAPGTKPAPVQPGTKQIWANGAIPNTEVRCTFQIPCNK